MDTLKAFFKVTLFAICLLLALTLASTVMAGPGSPVDPPPLDPVPEANILLLLGSGLITLFALKRKFNK